ncbi:hypothetical protein AGRI_02388 [Alishewanella agri BL06]|uniref:Uncharacterized protein n=1 Tax=Alishewanella agri BL06 TaxID=1195246 RepID=I9P596_9ALTE|nr:hypothetical protein [Alishewanella agri]EIW90162.1 hypothetical protein AGRI_02388 [Alishewanella agri BL06]
MQRKSFISTELAKGWLSQFSCQDQTQAESLLNSIRHISVEKVTRELKFLIGEILQNQKGVVGLYAEREIRKTRGSVHKIFKETQTKVKRAIGSGPKAIDPIFRYKQDVGSEGVVANIITQICKTKRSRVITHPGPDKIRKQKVRHLIIVTDFIGSGTRICDYLDAFWKVKSIRSWNSLKAVKFHVVAYSATQIGSETVRRHKAKPEIYIGEPCPTIWTVFSDIKERKSIIDLCNKYAPNKETINDGFFSRPKYDPLGYRGIGALMSFSYGVPNNVPEILFRASPKWQPIFKSRVIDYSITPLLERNSQLDIEKALIKLRENNIQTFIKKNDLPDHSPRLIVFLAAANRYRFWNEISEQTGLTVSEIHELHQEAISNKFINEKYILTDFGKQQLDFMRTQHGALAKQLDNNVPIYYVPKQLRALNGV